MNYNTTEQAILDAFQYAVDNDLFRNTAPIEFRRAKTNKAHRRDALRFAQWALRDISTGIDIDAQTYQGRDLEALNDDILTAEKSGRWPIDTVAALAAIRLIEGEAE